MRLLTTGLITLLTFAATGCTIPFDPYSKDVSLEPARIEELTNRLTSLDEKIAGAANEIEKVDSMNEKGIIYREMGKLRKAREEYQQALAIAPGYYLALHNLATVYEEAGDNAKAIETYRTMYDKATDLPGKAEAVDRMVLLYRQMKQPDEAERVVNDFAADHADEAKDMIVSLRNDIARTRAELTK